MTSTIGKRGSTISKIGYTNGKIGSTISKIGYTNGKISSTISKIGYTNGKIGSTISKIGYTNGKIGSTIGNLPAGSQELVIKDVIDKDDMAFRQAQGDSRCLRLCLLVLIIIAEGFTF
jgi:ubiquinone biosynthesis protein COQ9